MLIQSVLEGIQARDTHNGLWQIVPGSDNSSAEGVYPLGGPHLGLAELPGVASGGGVVGHREEVLWLRVVQSSQDFENMDHVAS